ncbi:MAG: hypothetical protein ACFFAX_06265 [Promethearchaeota archaeon]
MSKMSLLGPDDFDLDRKGRKKKLAKDLAPSIAKEIEKWLDKEDDPEAFRRVSELVGPEEATRLFARRRKHTGKSRPKDPLLEDQ